MLSIIIPSYKDPLLNKTVESLLEKAKGDIEIICVLDGYWAAPIGDTRVKVIHLGKNRGMREAINAGVAISKGEYLMRTDEHCIFGEAYDLILINDLQDNWIMTPRRYYLDAEKWEVMDMPPVDYSNLKIMKVEGGRKFHGYEDAKTAEARKDVLIDETFAMQGSCWIMKRSWWDKVIGRLDSEGYGPHYQDSIEMIFKTWKNGGKLMVNKKTWFAHKHRSFKRTHHYSLQRAVPEWKFVLGVWEGYYKKLIKKNRINIYETV